MKSRRIAGLLGSVLLALSVLSPMAQMERNSVKASELASGNAQNNLSDNSGNLSETESSRLDDNAMEENEEKNPANDSDTVSPPSDNDELPETISGGKSEENDEQAETVENTDLESEWTGSPKEDSDAELLGSGSWEESETVSGESDLTEQAEEEDMLAFAPAALDADLEATPMLLSAVATSYEVVNKDYVDVDEVTKTELYREIVYTDSDGVQQSSPLYCMEADKHGLSAGELKASAVKALKNSTIRKILYFGYGGPGDICSSYDPTCSHIRWSRWQNRYIFTHMALTKVYSGQYGDSNEKEYEHAGVNRFIEKIESLTIPNRSGVVFSSKDISGNSVTSKTLTTSLKGYPSALSGYSWIDRTQTGYEKAFQITELIQVQDQGNAGNSISIKKGSSSIWQLGYWTSEADYKKRGEQNPRLLSAGEQLTLKDGYRFYLAYPGSLSHVVSYNYSMKLKPVSFLLVDGSVQKGESNVQDFGAYVYQGQSGVASLTIQPYDFGSLSLVKSDVRGTARVSGATYQLYAAEDIYTYTSLIYEKDSLVEEGTTDADGELEFSDLLTGQYRIQESVQAQGYLLDTEQHLLTVQAGSNPLEVTDVPDIQAVIEVEKKDQNTGKNLEGAEFTLYEWSEKEGEYHILEVLNYDSETQRYRTGSICFTADNSGEFLVEESANPDGYAGVFSEKVSLSEEKAGQTKQILLTAENWSLFGSVTITKKIRESEITWAHGNPTFCFVVEGTDIYGIDHRYEDAVVFKQDGYTLDEDGYAVLTTVLDQIPLGKYRISEKKVLRYSLCGMYADTENMQITTSGAGSREAEATLSVEMPDAAVTMVNQKMRYDGYSHTSFLKNTIPVIFEED